MKRLIARVLCVALAGASLLAHGRGGIKQLYPGHFNGRNFETKQLDGVRASVRAQPS